MHRTENLKAAVAGHVCIHSDIKLDLSLLSVNLILTAFKGKIKEFAFLFRIRRVLAIPIHRKKSWLLSYYKSLHWRCNRHPSA